MMSKMSGWQFFNRKQTPEADEASIHVKEIKKVFRNKEDLTLEEREVLESIEKAINCDCEKDP